MQIKDLTKSTHPFLIKILSKLIIEKNFLNVMKGKCEKFTAHILNCKRWNIFCLISRTRQGYLISPLLFNSFL